MTTSPRPDAQLAAFLSRFPPEVVALAKQCLPKLRRAFPGTTQFVYDYRNSVVVAFSPTERGYEAPVAVAVEARGVRLYFPKDIPDPNGRLEGAGSKVRSVRVEAASELDAGDVRAFLKAASRLAGQTAPRTGSGRVVIQSGAKTAKASTRPARTRSASRASS